MAAINRVVLVGRLTRDPDIKHTQGGTEVANFSVAVNEREKVDGEWQDRASFFDCVAFGHTAEAVGQYLTKGKQVAIDGRLRQDRWETKDNEKRTKVVVVANTVQFLDKPNGESSSGQAEYEASQVSPDDDIPF